MADSFSQRSHCQEWILDRRDLMRSRAQDLSVLSDDEYQKIFIFFADIIQMLADELRIPRVIGIATVYFKRFYAKNSLRCADPLLLVPTCVYLASKVEALEQCGVIPPRRLIAACRRVVKNLNHAYSQEFPNFPYCMNAIWECEFCLLQSLEFSLVVYQPYRQLVDLVQQFGMHDRLKEMAWRLVNDSLRTDICLLYTPRQIAIGCLQIACVKLNDFTSWFGQVDEDLGKIQEINRLQANLVRVMKCYDEKQEIQDLLAKMPRPRTGPSSSCEG